ncbi:hypothetical protein Hdeb2414_s0003g00089321 [Helianthus debilis subsp. tardiflorus]
MDIKQKQEELIEHFVNQVSDSFAKVIGDATSHLSLSARSGFDPRSCCVY